MLLMLLVGCGNSAQKDAEPAANNQTGPVPAMTYAIGWSDFSMVANWAKTGVDALGHFSTSRNACGKEEYGALPLELWNQFSESINKAIESEPLAEEYCLPRPEALAHYFDGNAEIKLMNGKTRVLMDGTRGTGGCTTIRDHDIAAKLYEALNQIVGIADKEGCSVMPY